MKYYSGMMKTREVESELEGKESGTFMVWLKQYEKGHVIVLSYVTGKEVNHTGIMRDPMKDLFYYNTSKKCSQDLSTLISLIINKKKIFGCCSQLQIKTFEVLSLIIEEEQNEIIYENNTFQIDEVAIVLPKNS